MQFGTSLLRQQVRPKGEPEADDATQGDRVLQTAHRLPLLRQGFQFRHAASAPRQMRPLPDCLPKPMRFAKSRPRGTRVPLERELPGSYGLLPFQRGRMPIQGMPLSSSC